MANDNHYKPSGRIKDTNRTYVSGLYRQAAAEMMAEDGYSTRPEEEEVVVRLQNRPVIGVLYSISAGINGELFPVYIGRNTIGSDPACDICLKETSVSENHGLLLARKQTGEDGEEFVNVILSDNNSFYGTAVNGVKLQFDKVECADGDLISIGQNYVLVLSLFNAINKLSIAPTFDAKTYPKKEVEPSIPTTTGAINPQDRATRGGQTKVEPEQRELRDDESDNFYKPTKKDGLDHYNNETIIL